MPSEVERNRRRRKIVDGRFRHAYPVLGVPEYFTVLPELSNLTYHGGTERKNSQWTHSVSLVRRDDGVQMLSLLDYTDDHDVDGWATTIAGEPFKIADRWASVLVLAKSVKALRRGVHLHVFSEPRGNHVEMRFGKTILASSPFTDELPITDLLYAATAVPVVATQSN
jgi:hypothetical protein